MTPRQWFRVDMKAADPIADLYIYGDIGQSFWDDTAVSAQQFIQDLKALPESVAGVRVHVNSLGGSMFDGIAIANALRDLRAKGKTVETITDGVAASAASLVMMAGLPIRIGDNATMMIHEPAGFVMGTSADMRKSAEVFDGFRDMAVATYQWNSSLTAAEIIALMEAETWLSADEAIAQGFATEKVTGLQAAAALDARSLATLHVPDRFRAHVDALIKPEPKPVPAPIAAAALEVIRACNAAGCPELADELVATGATTVQVSAQVESAKAAKAAAAARANDIRSACALAKLPELADGYVAGAMAVSDVKAQLAVITAKLDSAEIDTSLAPNHRVPNGDRVINRTDIYKHFNKR